MKCCCSIYSETNVVYLFFMSFFSCNLFGFSLYYVIILLYVLSCLDFDTPSPWSCLGLGRCRLACQTAASYATLNILHLGRCSPQAQLGALMVILREHIAHMEKEELNAQQTELTAFFLTALDFRAEHCQVSTAAAIAFQRRHVICVLLCFCWRL